ncbi:MAG: NADPH-dependent FMN reductase [bacterium]
MRILGISGSLRAASYNSALLRTASQLLEGSGRLELADLSEIEPYSEDLDHDPWPPMAQAFKIAVERADALLIATPEYNHSIPGVLKNAIDWASRPAFASPLTGKPVGVLTVATGAVGGARAQTALHTILDSTLSPVFPSREMLVPNASNLFDSQGELHDETTIRRLKRYLDGFQEWVNLQRT